jgi:hypothetical protein
MLASANHCSKIGKGLHQLISVSSTDLGFKKREKKAE